MPTPLSTAGAAGSSDTWHELEDVLSGFGRLARSPIEPEHFYERVLVECVRALSATGGAAWLRSSSGTLRPVAHIHWPGSEMAANSESRRAHETLLTSAASEGRIVSSPSGTLVAPIAVAPNNSDPPTAQTTAAILEIIPRADCSPAAYRGYEQFLGAVCDLAGEYHLYRELSRLRRDENYRDQLVHLSTLVHRNLELAPAAYAVANEGRRVIGCDRLSVLAKVGRRTRLLATSGASHVEHRSAAARRLEQVADLVLATAEPAWYADGQSDALPPIADALEAHADESHARQIAVIPLARSAIVDIASAADRPSSPQEKPSCMLIAEQFDARADGLSKERLIDVGALCATALYNAREVDQLPLRWLLRPLAAVRRQVVHHVGRSVAIASGAAAAVAALVFVPADFTVEAPGTVEPVVRQEVFAPRGGLVDEVLVAHGTSVAAGQPLLKLRDPSLELDLKRVHGEMETVRRQLDAVRATKSSREIRDADPVELYRMSASERELEQQLTNLEGELSLLTHERDSLVVRSPIDGRVITWDLAGRLIARPVERGEALVTVADLSSDWQLELDVADDRIGYVLAAQEQAGPNALPVRFRLHSIDAPQTGQIQQVGMTASVDTNDAAAARPTVEVIVSFDKLQLEDTERRELRPGVSARAEIDCGRRSLGYVWLHDIWNTTLTWLRF
jgi:multidrug efflux pump subunit AcrA (membrane-fusion protein)